MRAYIGLCACNGSIVAGPQRLCLEPGSYREKANFGYIPNTRYHTPVARIRL